jgi:hypothetical protein
MGRISQCGAKLRFGFADKFLQLLLSNLTPPLPKSGTGCRIFHRKSFTFAKIFPDMWVRRRVLVFCFDSKMACDRWSVHAVKLHKEAP